MSSSPPQSNIASTDITDKLAPRKEGVLSTRKPLALIHCRAAKCPRIVAAYARTRSPYTAGQRFFYVATVVPLSRVSRAPRAGVFSHIRWPLCPGRVNDNAVSRHSFRRVHALRRTEFSLGSDVCVEYCLRENCFPISHLLAIKQPIPPRSAMREDEEAQHS